MAILITYYRLFGGIRRNRTPKVKKKSLRNSLSGAIPSASPPQKSSPPPISSLPPALNTSSSSLPSASSPSFPYGRCYVSMAWAPHFGFAHRMPLDALLLSTIAMGCRDWERAPSLESTRLTVIEFWRRETLHLRHVDRPPALAVQSLGCVCTNELLCAWHYHYKGTGDWPE